MTCIQSLLRTECNRFYRHCVQATYGQQVGRPVGLYFCGIDFSDPTIQGKMLRSVGEHACMLEGILQAAAVRPPAPPSVSPLSSTPISLLHAGNLHHGIITIYPPPSLSTLSCLRAWDAVLGNPFINASTSGFQGNWYITFNQWAANQTNLTQVRRIVRAIQARPELLSRYISESHRHVSG